MTIDEEHMPVVYHYNPTSNRNSEGLFYILWKVVYHYNPTSNRNCHYDIVFLTGLYIIIILHQTATIAA